MSDFSDFEDLQKRCNYCNLYNKLSTGKPYCTKCKTNCYRECRRCHKPYDDSKFFMKDETRCNSCHTKLEKERSKRISKRQHEQKEEEEDGEPSKKHSSSDSEKEESFSLLSYLLKNPNQRNVGFIPVFFK